MLLLLSLGLTANAMLADSRGYDARFNDIKHENHMPRRGDLLAEFYSKEPETDYFTVYVRNDFARAPRLEVYSIHEAHKNQVPSLSGVLPKAPTNRNEFLFKSDVQTSYIQRVQIASWWQRNWALDQFIEVTFNTGATVRYTMPRFGKLVRDRVDVWMRAGAGVFTDNGNYLSKTQKLDDYPQQLLILRPRVQGDSKFDTSYDGRARMFKKAAVSLATAGGAVVGAAGVATLCVGMVTLPAHIAGHAICVLLPQVMNMFAFAHATIQGGMIGGVGGCVAGRRIGGAIFGGDLSTADHVNSNHIDTQ